MFAGDTRTYKLDRLKAVIMVGRPDFGRCPVATRLNRALWPLGGRPVLQRLLEHIANQGVRRFVICGSEDIEQIKDPIEIPPHIEVSFRQERLPRGSAGCIFDAADADQDDLIFVLPATITSPPDLNELIREHRSHNSPLTIFCNPAADPLQDSVREAQIYVCDPVVLKHIPAAGYCDLKEGLVPKLIQADLSVTSAYLEEHAGNYTNWNEYITSVGDALLRVASGRWNLHGFLQQPAFDSVFAADDVVIDPSAKIIGPVILGARCVVEPDAVICGPTLVEPGVTIGARAVVCENVLWENAVVGSRCHLQHCLVDSHQMVPPATAADGKLIHSRETISGKLMNALRRMKAPFTVAKHALPVKLEELLLTRQAQSLFLVGFLLMFVSLVISYFNPTIINLMRVWSQSDEYSSGMLVPFLAVYIIWHRRKDWLRSPIKPAVAAVILLLGTQAMRFFGLLYYYESLERFSLLFAAGALTMLILGLPVFKKAFSVWLFCFLMFPLPKRVESMIAIPLQKWATVSAVYFLETLGYIVIREGNVININNTLVAVAEACNGLRMLTAFFVVSGFVVLLTDRPFWQKSLILLSSVPIALLCNTIRLAVTSIAFTVLNTEVWEQRFHDFGGLAMMPLALVITMLELWFLSHIFLPSTEPATSGIVIKRRRSNSIKDGSFSGTT